MTRQVLPRSTISHDGYAGPSTQAVLVAPSNAFSGRHSSFTGLRSQVYEAGGNPCDRSSSSAAGAAEHADNSAASTVAAQAGPAVITVALLGARMRRCGDGPGSGRRRLIGPR